MKMCFNKAEIITVAQAITTYARIIAGDPTTPAAAAVRASSCVWVLAAEGNVADQSTLFVHPGVEGASMKGEAETRAANGVAAGDAGDGKVGLQTSESKAAGSCIPDCATVQA